MFQRIREMNLKKCLKNLFSKLTGHNHILISGHSLIVEGGAGTGKTAYLNEVMRECEAKGEKVIYINASLPVTSWLKEYQLFGKNIDCRIYHLMKTLPEVYTLLVDNAERITSGQKMELVLSLIERATKTVITCSSYKKINPKILARLNTAQLISLGAGSNETFDITYFLVAFLIIVVAMMGAVNMIFLAAAIRYIFQGSRIGGRL